MFTVHLLVSVLLSVAFLSIDARPSVLSDAFINQDAGGYLSKLSDSDRSDAATLNQVFQHLIGSGLKLTLNDYVNMAKNRYPSLYKHLLEYQRKMDDRENALPAKAKQFIMDRREESHNWFPNGEFDQAALVNSIRAIGRDIAQMTDYEKAALLQQYPYMQTLLDNPHFQKILNGTTVSDEDLSSILVD